MTHAENVSDLFILGNLVQEFVNHVSHTQGKTLAALTDASVTLQQVLLLRRLASSSESTPSALAEQMHMSLPAVSQMVERLFQLDLVSRIDSPDDRRKKQLSVTRHGRALLKRIAEARTADYAAGIASLSPGVRTALARVLQDALKEL
ncbi:DNA-binding MarR family transcriptional regulator [Paraburkholderia youngii]|uniref:MarR family winged helix-turn-helix transcriptional regulator n=1 Tax=Paraburkholderia youngii TaxID=2782701 RepID=UPI003D1C4668